MTDDCRTLLRHLPKTDRVLLEPEVAALAETHGRAPVVEAVRASIDALRAAVLAGEVSPGANGELLAAVRREVGRRVRGGARRSLRPAINATGVVLHTGLGRAVLAGAAADAAAEAGRSHALLEVDAETGERGDRQSHCAALLRTLTGAEGALVVNNCAAAVFLAISALAAGREVVIARGQLVEIGGAFRIPDVIRAAGARLVEVGTTNRVRIADYSAAITGETALLLRVHPSNFRIVGFTEEASLTEMVELGKSRSLSVMDDVGSGALVDLSRHGLAAEPTVHASVRAGADVVTFSGDKLLGGPQAGVVLGSTEPLRRMKRHPLMRVVRPDKMTLAALEATLRLYRDEETALREVPTLAALAAQPSAMRDRAERLAALLSGLPLEVEVREGRSQVGGGSLPGEELPTTLVCVRSERCGAGELARRLRTGEPSVWGRVQRDRLLFDLRTVREDEVTAIAARLSVIAAEDGHDPAD